MNNWFLVYYFWFMILTFLLFVRSKRATFDCNCIDCRTRWYWPTVKAYRCPYGKQAAILKATDTATLLGLCGWTSCEKRVKIRNHVKSMLAKIQPHHISISHACERFDMHVKFCNTCQTFSSHVWTCPYILLRVPCDAILSCMWTSNFTCIIDPMHVKNFTCTYVNTFKHVRVSRWNFSGLVKCNHYEPHFYENAQFGHNLTSW